MEGKELQWSRILKKQDQFVHNMDEEEQQYRKNIKQLYKQQLDEIVNQHRRHAKDEKEFDKKLLQYSQQLQQAKRKQEQQKNHYLHYMREKLARDNLRSVENKRKKNRVQTEGVKNFYNHNFEKIQTQMEEQGRSRMRKRQSEKNQLSIAYDEQITEHGRRKQWEKLEDEKMMNLLSEIQEKKQRDRQKYFSKIRNYHQNPQVYENVQKIMYKKQRNHSQFLSKIANDHNQEQALRLKTLQQANKNKRVREVSHFNHQYGQQRKFQQRNQSLQEIAEYSRRFDELNRKLKQQQEKKQLDEERKRLSLKEELQHQIQDLQKKKKMSNMLDQREYQLNRSDQVPALPGLWKDHSAIKQQQILQNFLKGKSAYH